MILQMLLFSFKLHIHVNLKNRALLFSIFNCVTIFFNINLNPNFCILQCRSQHRNYRHPHTLWY